MSFSILFKMGLIKHSTGKTKMVLPNTKCGVRYLFRYNLIVFLIFANFWHWYVRYSASGLRIILQANSLIKKCKTKRTQPLFLFYLKMVVVEEWCVVHEGRCHRSMKLTWRRGGLERLGKFYYKRRVYAEGWKQEKTWHV